MIDFCDGWINVATTATRIQRTIPCEYRERLYRYMSQTVKALIAAQESEVTSTKTDRFWRPRYGAGLIAAANAWKQAQVNYEQHVRDHGCLSCADCAALASDLNGVKSKLRSPRAQ